MPAAYIPLLLFALLVLSLPVIARLVAKHIAFKSPTGPAEVLPEVATIPVESNANGGYPARFYVVAMLFATFEVLSLYLFLWAIRYRSWLVAHSGGFALISMLVFFGILLVGYVWVYQKGALDWD